MYFCRQLHAGVPTGFTKNFEITLDSRIYYRVFLVNSKEFAATTYLYFCRQLQPGVPTGFTKNFEITLDSPNYYRVFLVNSKEFAAAELLVLL